MHLSCRPFRRSNDIWPKRDYFHPMLVSHRQQFIYTKTHKTAGTSVEVYFEPYCLPEGSWTFAHYRKESVTSAGIVGFRGEDRDPNQTNWWAHMPAALIKERVGADIWKRYFKFCVIRDPFDQMISMFHFSRRAFDYGEERLRDFHAGTLRDDTTVEQPFPPELKARFKAWLLHHKFRDRDRFAIDGEICVDYFIRYERLEEGIEQVCQRIGVPFEPGKISRLKAGLRPPHEAAQYYDREAIDFLSEACRFELEHFGYQPPRHV